MYLIFLFFFAKLSFLQIEDQPQKMISYFETYTNEAHHYQIDYPDDWKKTDQQGFDLFLVGPQGEGKCDANLSIISGEIPKGIDLKVYAEENLKNLAKEAKIKVIESGDREIAGIPAYWVRYTRSDYNIEIVHYFFIKDSVGYLITTGSVIGCYDQYQESFDQIVGSFRQTIATEEGAEASPDKGSLRQH
jgi:hypothetical protein